MVVFFKKITVFAAVVYDIQFLCILDYDVVTCRLSKGRYLKL